MLVGQKGVTLQSLQELVRSMVQRRFVGQAHARVRVDVAGYRERRRIALERFTIEIAEGVLDSGVAKALDPMSAADRKVVHDSVNAIDGVETVSEGEDDNRHVVIRAERVIHCTIGQSLRGCATTAHPRRVRPLLMPVSFPLPLHAGGSR